jgi:hypothetical protein
VTHDPLPHVLRVGADGWGDDSALTGELDAHAAPNPKAAAAGPTRTSQRRR